IYLRARTAHVRCSGVWRPSTGLSLQASSPFRRPGVPANQWRLGGVSKTATGRCFIAGGLGRYRSSV
ncbi:hypothetical protein KFL_000400010, partial [Klebsormidium nitens]